MADEYVGQYLLGWSGSFAYENVGDFGPWMVADVADRRDDVFVHGDQLPWHETRIDELAGHDDEMARLGAAASRDDEYSRIADEVAGGVPRGMAQCGNVLYPEHLGDGDHVIILVVIWLLEAKRWRDRLIRGNCWRLT